MFFTSILSVIETGHNVQGRWVWIGRVDVKSIICFFVHRDIYPFKICVVCKARRRWTLEQWKRVLLEWWITLHHLAVRRTNLGLADARRTLPVRMHSANCKVWWMFFMVRARPLQVKGNLNATAYNYILCFQLCGNSLGEALSCFSMTIPPCTKRVP